MTDKKLEAALKKTDKTDEKPIQQLPTTATHTCTEPSKPVAPPKPNTSHKKAGRGRNTKFRGADTNKTKETTVHSSIQAPGLMSRGTAISREDKGKTKSKYAELVEKAVKNENEHIRQNKNYHQLVKENEKQTAAAIIAKVSPPHL